MSQQPINQAKFWIAGFTLIEMLIVITIMAVLSTGSVVSYRVFSQRQQVLQSAKNIQEAMRFAQKKARVGEKPAGCLAANQRLSGYQVTGAVNSATITVSAICVSPNATIQVTTYQLVGNVQLSAALSVTFVSITGGVLPAGTTTVRVGLGGYAYSFTVNQGGNISEGAYL